jgi:hypothetical protein
MNYYAVRYKYLKNGSVFPNFLHVHESKEALTEEEFQQIIASELTRLNKDFDSIEIEGTDQITEQEFKNVNSSVGETMDALSKKLRYQRLRKEEEKK